MDESEKTESTTLLQRSRRDDWGAEGEEEEEEEEGKERDNWEARRDAAAEATTKEEVTRSVMYELDKEWREVKAEPERCGRRGVKGEEEGEDEEELRDSNFRRREGRGWRAPAPDDDDDDDDCFLLEEEGTFASDASCRVREPSLDARVLSFSELLTGTAYPAVVWFTPSAAALAGPSVPPPGLIMFE